MVIDYKYPKSRWFMLGFFMFLTIVVELQWLTHAPLARVSETFSAIKCTAEITASTPESTSQGILLLVGQISGIIMVTLMSTNNNLYLDHIMKMFVPLAIIAFVAVLFIKESDIKNFNQKKSI